MELNSFKISFESAIMQLINLCNHVERRKQWCVKICNDCQQLMKPWPASVLEEKKQRKSNDSLSLGKSEDRPGEHLTAADVEELKLVERALRKAGKTRQLFKRELNDCENVVDLSAPVVSVNSSDTESVKTIESSKLPLRDCPKRTGINPKDQKMSDKTRITRPRNVNSTKTQNISVKSKKQQNVEEEKSSDVAVISQTALDFLRNSALSKSETSKAQSSVRHRPAHENAPFLTLPQVKSTKTFHTHKSIGDRRSSSSSLHSKTYVQSVNSSSKDHHYNRNSNANHLNVDKMRSRMSCSVADDCCSESPNATGRPLLTEPQTDAAAQQVLPSEKSFDENSNHAIAVGVGRDADATETQDTRFRLLRDGSSLKLPSELSKALSKNYQLNSKLESSKERKRRLHDGESSSQNFCDLLQRHIDDCTGNCNSFEQSLQYNRISGVLVWLKRLLDTATSVDISDNSPAEVIVRTQKTIEYVISEFSSLKDILRSLHLDERPPHGSKGIDEIQVKQRHNRDIVMNWFSDDGPYDMKLIRSSRIKYENEHQLVKYTTLSHNAQLLQLRSMVLEAIGSDAIALLNRLPSNDRLFPLLYQSFYSLICSFGSSFPAIVKVIGDDED